MNATPTARVGKAALAQSHLTRLAMVPAMTDMPTTRQHARDLAREVELGGGHYGSLGSNGIAPAVDACIRSARFHGFDWRTRNLDAIPGRIRTTAAFLEAAE